ncbi:hypothetical protein [Pukyongiella litopenaei]|uniref:Lipoprotein n=1 Tax=Pukyongiella litopenaei TaxID=2605946 RepID=A0A2S0MKQ5_9RHOB|nr:hypothetical protein [Pukyongiella litopenaei]AVO36460.1 hypothetical protein C6Y53_01210 [Pukyongiella litopenaei]
MIPKTVIAIAAICVLTGCETDAPATGGTAAAGDIRQFEGAKAGQAEMAIQNMGYRLVRSQGLTSFWYNDAIADCAQIVTSEGRYASITSVDPGVCA